MIRLGILALVVLCAVLALTNPNHEAHKDVVFTSAVARVTDSKLVGKIAADVLGSVDVVPLKYHNYFLFSTTTLRGETASIGLFTHVWKRDLSTRDPSTTDE
jgi:hypothetical protein